jgi:hypothetical protein
MYNTECKDYNNRKKLKICNNMAEAIREIEEGCTTNDMKKKASGFKKLIIIWK